MNTTINHDNDVMERRSIIAQLDKQRSYGYDIPDIFHPGDNLQLLTKWKRYYIDKDINAVNEQDLEQRRLIIELNKIKNIFWFSDSIDDLKRYQKYFNGDENALTQEEIMNVTIGHSICSGLEWTSGFTNILNLKGWTRWSMYDKKKLSEAYSEVIDKYSKKPHISPEIQLIMKLVECALCLKIDKKS